MPNAPITKRTADAAKPRVDKANRSADAYLWDAGKGAVTGFGLKVTAAGSKVFVLQYRLRGTRTDKRYKIGRYGDWTPEQARERARELRRLIDSGVDPLNAIVAKPNSARRMRGPQSKRRLALSRTGGSPLTARAGPAAKVQAWRSST
jgi:hypothetical protein